MNTLIKSEKTPEKQEKDNIILDKYIKLGVENILDSRYTIEEYNISDFEKLDFDKLLNVANDGFGIEMDLDDVKNHIYKSEYVFLLKINGEIVGFSSLANLGDFVYRFGTVIKKDYQANGLYKRLSKSIMDNSKYYFTRTQNKNVIKSLESEFDIVLYGEEALDFMLRSNLSLENIGDFVIDRGDREKTLSNNGIFKGVYPGKMGEESRVNHIEDDFYKGFSSENGDSLLVVYFNK